jgi:hypothetical protein
MAVSAQISLLLFAMLNRERVRKANSFVVETSLSRPHSSPHWTVRSPRKLSYGLVLLLFRPPPSHQRRSSHS